MNPRYLAYCNSHSKTADEMMAHDIERWPGGKMCGFMLWISEQWQAWDTSRGFRADRNTVRPQADHDAFDAWLADKFHRCTLSENIGTRYTADGAEYNFRIFECACGHSEVDEVAAQKSLEDKLRQSMADAMRDLNESERVA